jgi:hypothetical protein
LATNQAHISIPLTGLTPDTLYHYQASASNVAGAVSNADSTFQTYGPPIIVSQSASAIHPTVATLNASVNPSGAASKVWFQYGPTAAYGGVTAPVSMAAGSSPVPVSTLINGLTSSNTYYYQVVASNSFGQSASVGTNFSTTSFGPVFTVTTPVDGIGITGSLRAAITSANLVQDAIVDASKIGGEIGLYTALPIITNGMLIRGPGSNNLEIFGEEWRVFFVDVSNDAVIISNLSISDGRTTGGAGGNPGGGTIGSLVCSNGGIVLPGHSGSTGQLTAGSTTWSGNGTYVWQIANAFGIYSVLNVNGTLNVSTVSGFTVNVLGVGSVPDFNPATPYSWTLVHTTGGVVGFNASNYSIVLGAPFNSSATGIFSLAVSGDNLVLNCSPPPIVTTQAPGLILITQALLSGSVNPNSSPAAAWFNYGSSTNYGSVTPTNFIGSGTSSVTVTNLIGGLQQGTTYHYQIVASNANGTATGNDVSFTTLVPFSFTNITVQPGQSVLLQGNGSPNTTYSVEE